MNDFRLTVFLSVVKNKSFTKASNELHISQPAISQHIKEIERFYNVRLFERKKNTILLTRHGKIFFSYANDIHSKYQELEFEMNLTNQQDKGKLTIGASTTISQYILPPIMAVYMNRFPEIELSLISGNSEQIEEAVYNREVDFGFVEGLIHKKEFNYSVLAKDELVLVTSVKNKTKNEIDLEELKTLPLILRENGSGTLAVLQNILKYHNIKLSDLNILIQLGSSESIKRFVKINNSYAIISIAAIQDELKENKLKIIEIKNMPIDRQFSYIILTGIRNKLAEKFFQFACLTHKNML